MRKNIKISIKLKICGKKYQQITPIVFKDWNKQKRKSGLTNNNLHLTIEFVSTKEFNVGKKIKYIVQIILTFVCPQEFNINNTATT